MPRPELRTPERRDQPINALVTKSERAAVDRVAQQLGMSRSNAARYLMNLGMAEFNFTPTDNGDQT